MQSSVLLAIAGGVIAVLFAAVLTAIVLRRPPGNERMQEIGAAIREGAAAYLNRQYLVIAIIGIVIAIILGFLLNWTTAILYLVGAACSAAAGYVGMNVSVRANMRTAQAGRSGLRQAMATAFRGGAVTG
ncbi:MAG: sodium/proton-translocating pyrophosphatase, partial [Candidatus Dormibacteraeota bacterium]|nr:sodium/proton-translocating pyrophosphatase [Candidatus Dormibacteraeota bacterium]